MLSEKNRETKDEIHIKREEEVLKTNKIFGNVLLPIKYLV